MSSAKYPAMGSLASDRQCVNCGEWYSPWGMGDSRRTWVLVEAIYTCLTCRTPKVAR